MFWLVDIVNWTAEPVSPGQEIHTGLRTRQRYRQIFADQEAEALALAAERVEREQAAARKEASYAQTATG